jgi:3-hydroxyisobutyrate dehydrogenase-like beta-hydroxyacid dehydrogenase
MNIGFIGLGEMGLVIVPRLLAAGHTVTGWNRTKSKGDSLIEQGMKWADTPREVANQSEVVFSIVTDVSAVRTVALGSDGIIASLKPDAVYLDMSTIAPDDSRAISSEFQKAGLIMLDAPISGSPVTVVQGKASIMVGGNADAFQKVRPVLLDIGANATRIGDSGMAVQMKLAINLVLMVEIIAFGEGMALAEKGGVARDVALEAMLNSVAASPVMGYRGPFILEGNMPEKPLADVTLQQKDMTLVLELARKSGCVAPLAAAANEMMNVCRGFGLDHNDFVVAFEAYRRMGGMTPNESISHQS